MKSKIKGIFDHCSHHYHHSNHRHQNHQSLTAASRTSATVTSATSAAAAASKQSANYKSNVSVNRDVVHVHHRSRSSSKANLNNDVEAAMAAAAASVVLPNGACNGGCIDCVHSSLLRPSSSRRARPQSKLLYLKTTRIFGWPIPTSSSKANLNNDLEAAMTAAVASVVLPNGACNGGYIDYVHSSFTLLRNRIKA